MVNVLLNYLNSVKEIQIIGEKSGASEKRVPTISFIHKKLKSPDIVAEVDKEDIGIRFGDFYAKKLILNLDLEQYGGVLRVSPGALQHNGRGGSPDLRI